VSLEEALASAVAEVIDRRISELLDAPRLEMQPQQPRQGAAA